MKRLIIIAVLLSSFIAEALSQNVGEVKTQNSHMTKSGDYMAVLIDMGLDSLRIRNGRAYLLTPSIVKGDSVLTLHSVGVYSFNRWYYYKRNGEFMLAGSSEVCFRDIDMPEMLSYEEVVPYSGWMDGSELKLTLREYGCCSKVVNSWDALLARYDGPYMPAFLYVAPQVETHKLRQLKGSAFVDFPVSQTVIYPDYRNNQEELAKIRATLDFVIDDSDVTVKSMSIKGFASPESPYANNTRLASGRTEALKNYVLELYSLPADFIRTSYEPENWEGLRAYVDSSDLAHKAEILGLIDADIDPDKKEWKIKSVYKDEYQYLLKNCYPALRRSDYLIEYEVRSYLNVSEIARVFYEKPQNLSLNEMYAYAQELDKDSEEFSEVFETAVRMFPDDEIANINAANIAMKRGELNKAKRYLEKSGDSPQAMYARGIYEYLNGNIDMAAAIFSDALRKGVTEAEIPIARIQEMKEIQKKYMRPTTSSSY